MLIIDVKHPIYPALTDDSGYVAALWLATGAVLGGCGIVAAVATQAELNQWVVATRWTARLSLILFAAAYVMPDPSRVRAIGLAFAGAHFVHAFTFIVYLSSYPVTRGLVSTIGGTLGYVVLAAMTYSSIRPKVWGVTVRKWGMPYLWVVFSFSYLGRIVENGSRSDEGWFGLAVLALIPVSRLALGQKRASNNRVFDPSRKEPAA